MEGLRAKASLETPIQDIFLGKVIKGVIAEAKPRRGGVTIEFDDSSYVHIWFESVDLERWEVTGALRVIERFSPDRARGSRRSVGSADGIFVSEVSLLCADVRMSGADLTVANGLVLSGSKGESITAVSTSGAGTMDFGVNVALEALDAEYSPKNYRLEALAAD